MKIWQTADGKYKDGKYLVLRRDGTIPEWPNFVIGGYDPCAAPAMRAYAAARATMRNSAPPLSSWPKNTPPSAPRRKRLSRQTLLPLRTVRTTLSLS